MKVERKRTKWKKFYTIVAFSVFFILIICSIFRIHEPLELKVYDILMKLKPQRVQAQDIFFLIIDEEVKDEGLWPWRENWLAYLVNFLSGIGVKAVVIDSSLVRFVPRIAEHPLVKSAQTRTTVLYPQPDSLEGRDLDFVLDRDNRVRRFALFSGDGEEILPSIVLRTALIYFGVGQENLRLIKNKEIEINSAEKINIPLLLGRETLINYNKNVANIKRYSYFDLAFAAFLHSRQESPTINFGDFNGKICFVGICATTRQKIYATPIKFACPSLEIRANMLDNIINKNFIYKLRPEENLVILLVSLIVSLFIFSKLNLLKRSLGLLGLMVLYILTSSLTFFYLDIWVDTVLPGIAILITFLGITIHRYGLEQEIRLEEHRRELGRQLKKESLDKNALVTDNFEVIIKTSSPKEAEGDFYDILELDENRLVIIIGKAPGKNLNTVNYIIKVLDEFRAQAPLHRRPRAVLNAANNTLFPDGAQAMYATCLYFEIEPSRGILNFANAGHEPFILVRQTSSELEIQEAPNPTPLGVAKNVLFSDQIIELGKGDLIVAFTKGIVELKNKNGTEFGIERLKEVVNQYRSWEISKLANKVFEKVHRFSEGQEVNNECSLLLLRIKAELKTSEVLNERREQVIQTNQ